jgi:hypothetical protein
MTDHPSVAARSSGGMKVAIVTDAWLPRTNGVMRTLVTTIDRMRADGIDVHVISQRVLVPAAWA